MTKCRKNYVAISCAKFNKIDLDRRQILIVVMFTSSGPSSCGSHLFVEGLVQDYCVYCTRCIFASRMIN